MALHIKIESANLQAALKQLMIKIGDLRWLWPDMAGEFYKREQALFQAEGEGGWIGLSPKYAEWKAKYYPGQPMMVLKNDLRTSFVARLSAHAIYEDEPKSLTLGSSVPYAAAHHYGYPPRNLPARPLIIIDDQVKAGYMAVAEREFMVYCESLGFGVTQH